jgi:DNA-binding NarL/FixJ family response regulator
MSIRLVLADDHPLILEALANLFRLQDGFEVVAACSDGTQALQEVRLHRPDILVLDLRMPGKSGLDVLREMAGEHLPTRTVLLTAMIEDAEMLEAMRLGVGGIVLKEMAPASVVLCVRKVHAGEPWLEKKSAARALDKLMRRESGAREAAGILTARELEIVRMLCRGLRNKEIAAQMTISEHTVKVHLRNIYAKLEVDGRLALMRYAEDKGLI